MLYVFHVDTGSMLTFDINLALESVVQLKESIEFICHIPVDKQVLLVSGGECLDPSARVCSYSAGTDTNPIFLFSKSSIESTTPPSPSIDHGSDTDLKEQVDATLTMPATISAVAVRAQLAQQFCELAREQTRICENLVHDQHLQQQGWSAVIANLDDITAAFTARSELFDQSYKQHLDSRDEFLQLLDSFSADLETLSKVPLLQALVEPERTDEEEVTEIPNEPIEDDNRKTLLDWISAKDQQSSLQQVAEQCRLGLERFDEKVLEILKTELNACIDAANTSDLREIKGLEDRLYGLEQLMCETKKIVQEQGDLAQAFLQNQTRANNLGDASILPDLCASHRRQLQVMLKNHQQLRDIRRRCVLAKEELSVNLYQRLKWVMFVENKICEMDGKLIMYQESLKRLRGHLQVVQQLHVTPHIYLSAVAEVVRRRTFSQAFLLWAGDLACQLCAIHSEEVARRKTFQEQFEGHFLNSLFPGLEDSPPPFATQAPALFDAKLPKLSLDDIEILRTELPDLALSLSVPDLSHITQFFLAKSITATLKTEPKGTAASIEDRLVEVVTAVGLGSNLDPALLQPADSQTSAGPSYNTQPTSDRGFESETDTEEFEKVGQSPTELAFDKQDRPPHQRPEEEISALKEQIARLGGPVNSAVVSLRLDLNSLRDWLTIERNQICAMLHDLMTTYNRCLEEKDVQIRTLNKALENNKEEITRLQCFSVDLENRLKSSLEKEDVERQRREAAELSLGLCQEQQERVIKEVTEQLTHNHKKEIEAVRSRFRLMASTSMERSPSDTSLEKIERSDLIELVNHEAIVNQLKETLQLEKDKALIKEKEHWEKQLHKLRLKFESEKQISINEAIRRVLNERSQQLENMKLRTSSLEAECQKHKETINRLMDNTGSGGSESCSLLERVEALEIAKVQLELELLEARKQTPRIHQDMSTSVALVDVDVGNRDAATSPDPVKRSHLREKLTRSTTSLIQQGKLSIGSCNIGDSVLVVWDEVLSNYTIVQDSTTLYFLHSDCIDILQLRPSADCSLRRTYFIGEVLEKEYCHAKKPGNRYNVPKGTKFYAVKVKPLPALSRSQHTQSSQSHSTSSVGSN